MSRTWRIEFKDTVLSSNIQELHENDINTISTLKAQDFEEPCSKLQGIFDRKEVSHF